MFKKSIYSLILFNLQYTNHFEAIMPSYKLHYFNLRARGEIARLIFAASGTSYEDIRVTDWPGERKNLQPPFGQVPVLEVDGVKLCQSVAIGSFLANEMGLAGETPLDRARAIMIAECAKEVMDETISMIFDSDKVKRAERIRIFDTEKLPTKLGYFEQMLESNGGQWFVGKKLTWADLAIIDIIKFVENEGHPIPWAAIPKLQAHRKNIEAIPAIASYLASRPSVTR